MSRYSDTVVDTIGNPVAGVQVMVMSRPGDGSTPVATTTLTTDAGGALSNPVASGLDGVFYFNAPTGDYTLQFRTAGSSRVFASKAITLGGPLEADLAAPAGASKVGYGGRTVANKLGEFISVKDTQFAGGAKGDAVTDDTAALAAALAYIGITGGRLYFPRGIYLSDPISLTIPSGLPIRMFGDGKDLSVIRKRANSSAALLTITTDQLDNYTSLEDLRFDNGFRTPAGTGIKFTDTARMNLTRVNVRGFDIGINNDGGLIWTADDCTLLGNNTGFMSRKSTAGTYANLIRFSGGEIRGGNVGVDIDQASGTLFEFVDFETIGTAGNTSHGAVKIGANMAQESGSASITFEDCWFEGINGRYLQGSAANTEISIVRCDLTKKPATDEVAVNLTGFASINLVGVRAVAAASTFTIQATRSQVIGGQIGVLADTSTHRFHSTTTSTQDFTSSSTSFRLSHSVSSPTADDSLWATDAVLIGGSANNSSIYKYGAGRFAIRFAGGAMLGMSDGKIGFGSKADAPITIPTLSGGATTADIVTHLKALGLAV